MARDYTLQLIILHVLTEAPPYFVAEAGASPERLLANSETEGRQLLADAAALAQEAGVTVFHRAAVGTRARDRVPPGGRARLRF